MQPFDKHMDARSAPKETSIVSTRLADWSRALEQAVQGTQPEAAVALAQVILHYVPRHLATYHRLLRLIWQLKRWEEGADWARRLLQADPGRGLAWRALARGAEERQQRAEAYAMWQRAFEVNPYDPEIRAGINRTSLQDATALDLNLACLGALYMRAHHWAHAANTYRVLVRADARRIDFQLYLMVALWQSRAVEDAYVLARHLAQEHPYLLAAWVVLDATGDENDQALARSPIETLDPDREYVARIMRIPSEARRGAVQETVLTVTSEEAALLTVGGTT